MTDHERELPHLTEGYGKSRLQVVVSSGLLLLIEVIRVKFIGPLPLIGVALENPEIIPYILVVVLCYSFVRMMIEWAQSDSQRRRRLPSKIDITITTIIAAVGIGTFLLRFIDFKFLSGIPVITSLTLILLGSIFGQSLATAIYGLFFIRRTKEALRLGLHRMPVATRSMIKATLMLTPLLVLCWALSYSFAPPMSSLWEWFLFAPMFLIIIPNLIWMLGSLKFGDTYQKLRQAYDEHDAAYQVGGWDWPARHSHLELCEAAKLGEIEKVKQLIAAGADPNERGRHGWTPLMFAVAEQHVETAKFLLDKGADPNAKNLLRRTSLMFASKYGNEALVKALLKAGGDPNVGVGSEVEPDALGAAALEGHRAIVESLLKAGADPSRPSLHGKRPHELAQEGGHGEIAVILRRALNKLERVNESQNVSR